MGLLLAFLPISGASAALTRPAATSPTDAVWFDGAGLSRSVALAAGRRQGAAPEAEGELDDLETRPLGLDLDPEAAMRSRPFIIGERADAAFGQQTDDDESPQPLSETVARDSLGEFLDRRGVTRATRAAALARYDDPETSEIVPAPSLRAALLMLSGWKPYQATIDAVLDGANPSGRPFLSVDFGRTGIGGAVATLVEGWSGGFSLIVAARYAGDRPEQLIPLVVHEALHGGGGNSREEEIIANILDTICYAEVLLVAPEAATVGSQLAVFNNATLLALLNSTGRAGPSRLGISASPLGDVWLGPHLEDVDGASIRDAIGDDRFYDSLPRGGSPGQPTLSALLGRFPGAAALGPEPDFGEPALAVIDRGIGDLIPPVDAVDLARLLGLDVVGAVVEEAVAAALPRDPVAAVGRRPFVPMDTDLFTIGAPIAGDVPSPTSSQARAALGSLLEGGGATSSVREELLARFDDPVFRTQIADPSLRVAALLLGGGEPWDVTLATVLGGTGRTGSPIPIRFADLPYGIPVAREASPDAVDGETRATPRTPTLGPAILINRDLVGEAPALLASYVVEGTLIDAPPADEPPAANQAVAAALLGTLAYADLIALSPEVVATGTAATVARNRQLLALLNSGARPQATAVAEEAGFGFLAAPDGVDDVLPGLYADAGSFADYAVSQARAVETSGTRAGEASRVFRRYLVFAGVASRAAGAPSTFDRATLEDLDAELGAFLSPAEVRAAARTLRLGVGG